MITVYGDIKSGNCYKVALLFSHPTIAVRRFINKFLGMPSERQAEYDSKEEPGYRALGVMETGWL